jgi:hypothetical protein
VTSEAPASTQATATGEGETFSQEHSGELNIQSGALRGTQHSVGMTQEDSGFGQEDTGFSQEVSGFSREDTLFSQEVSGFSHAVSCFSEREIECVSTGFILHGEPHALEQIPTGADPGLTEMSSARAGRQGGRKRGSMFVDMEKERKRERAKVEG